MFNLFFKIETWEMASYIVTVLGLPLAIFVFVHEQSKERENEEEEVYQMLSDNYQDFLKVVLDHSDLHLLTAKATLELNETQQEKMWIVFSMLISLFERAYVLLYSNEMSPQQRRRWQSWDDYIVEWCQREDFQKALTEQLRGEDPDFARYIQNQALKATAK